MKFANDDESTEHKKADLEIRASENSLITPIVQHETSH